MNSQGSPREHDSPFWRHWLDRKQDRSTRGAPWRWIPSTRQGAWRGLGIGLVGGALVALFPAVGIGAGLLLGATGGAGLGALARHVSAGLKRADLKDLGELLDEGHSGLVVVAASDLGDRVQHVMKRASKVTRKQLQADEAAVARDIEAAASGPDQGGP